MRIGEVNYTNLTNDFGYWTVKVEDIKNFEISRDTHVYFRVLLDENSEQFTFRLSLIHI